MRIQLYLAVIVLWLMPPPVVHWGALWPSDAGAVLAQDDDGDDDDDDDAGGGGGGGGDDDDDTPAARRGGGGNDDTVRTPTPRTPQRTQPRTPPAPVVIPVPRPSRVAREIVVLNLSDDDLAILLVRGYQVVETRAIAGLGTTSRRLRAPQDLPLTAARAEVRALPSGQDADFNHFYRTEQQSGATNAAAASATPLPCDGAHCSAFTQIGWRPTPAASCGPPMTIGMVDTGVNADHTAFADADLQVIRLTDAKQDPSRALHGTAVAAILIGDPASRSPGLVPHLPLVAVDIFHRKSGDERADVFALIESLGLLAERGARVINLSLAGPPNTVLEAALLRLTEQDGIVVVAAAGNAGPRARPAYPAAYDTVIAVTAVDRNNTIYRRAGRGAHIALAAPGVDVWTAASVSGARSKTGTSFATPFVTAAAALLLQQNPDLRPADLRRMLAESALDLGSPAFDPVFGHGLVQMNRTPHAPCRDKVQ